MVHANIERAIVATTVTYVPLFLTLLRINVCNLQRRNAAVLVQKFLLAKLALLANREFRNKAKRVARSENRLQIPRKTTFLPKKMLFLSVLLTLGTSHNTI